jgi:predicted DNA-binding transcriptional regulator AlpA
MLDKELLTENQVWNRYGLSISWQRRTRRERRGPRFLKLGKMVRYRRSDIEAYLSAHAVEPKQPSTEGSATKQGEQDRPVSIRDEMKQRVALQAIPRKAH